MKGVSDHFLSVCHHIDEGPFCKCVRWFYKCEHTRSIVQSESTIHLHHFDAGKFIIQSHEVVELQLSSKHDLRPALIPPRGKPVPFGNLQKL